MLGSALAAIPRGRLRSRPEHLRHGTIVDTLERTPAHLPVPLYLHKLDLTHIMILGLLENMETYSSNCNYANMVYRSTGSDTLCSMSLQNWCLEVAWQQLHDHRDWTLEHTLFCTHSWADLPYQYEAAGKLNNRYARANHAASTMHSPRHQCTSSCQCSDISKHLRI